MTITSITPAGFLNGFNITLDTGESLTTFSAVLSEFGLKAGMDISEEDFEYIRMASDISGAEKEAAELLKKRPMIKRELARGLQERGYSREVAEASAASMARQGRIDEQKFALMLAKHYVERGYGAGKIIEEFFERAIPERYWEQALACCPDPKAPISAYIETRMKDKPLEKAARMRNISSLLERGYKYEDIEAALNEYESGHPPSGV